jgi:glutathione S-transferase
MAGLTVYHRQGAGRPIRLLWALEEAGADYELVVMDAEEGKSEAHLARHPLGRVPVLVDEQGPMFESTALIFHVAELYPDSGLMPPAGTHERALAQQWAIFAMTELEPPAIDAARNREPYPELSAKAGARAAKAVAAIGDALNGSPPTLVGEQLTVADIVAGDVLRMAVRRFELVDGTPTIEAYIDSLLERPARQRAIARIEN